VLGSVRLFDSAKGFGFITPDAGADVFVHKSALHSGMFTLIEGQRVTFDIETDARGTKAVNIKRGENRRA
jgi:cold shock protein